MRRVSRRQAARNRDAKFQVMLGGALFKEAIAGEPCAVCGVTAPLGYLQAHHCISQQRLRKLGLACYLWHPGNAVALCKRCHDRETTAKRRVTRAELPSRVFDFVRLVIEETGIDLGVYLPQEEKAA